MRSIGTLARGVAARGGGPRGVKTSTATEGAWRPGAGDGLVSGHQGPSDGLAVPGPSVPIMAWRREVIQRPSQA